MGITPFAEIGIGSVGEILVRLIVLADFILPAGQNVLGFLRGLTVQAQAVLFKRGKGRNILGNLRAFAFSERDLFPRSFSEIIFFAVG